MVDWVVELAGTVRSGGSCPFLIHAGDQHCPDFKTQPR
jgi:hypothetical protein